MQALKTIREVNRRQRFVYERDNTSKNISITVHYFVNNMEISLGLQLNMVIIMYTALAFYDCFPENTIPKLYSEKATHDLPN